MNVFLRLGEIATVLVFNSYPSQIKILLSRSAIKNRMARVVTKTGYVAVIALEDRRTVKEECLTIIYWSP